MSPSVDVAAGEDGKGAAITAGRAASAAFEDFRFACLSAMTLTVAPTGAMALTARTSAGRWRRAFAVDVMGVIDASVFSAMVKVLRGVVAYALYPPPGPAVFAVFAPRS